jgi:hypothetical protein
VFITASRKAACRQSATRAEGLCLVIRVLTMLPGSPAGASILARQKDDLKFLPGFLTTISPGWLFSTWSRGVWVSAPHHPPAESYPASGPGGEL